MPFLATEQLGPTQSLTPEGYLLCANVPIARTGSQIYAAHELPSLAPGKDGLITVVREESEVFHPDTIASFEGKSVTVYHQFVDPQNVRRVEVGHAQNVRRSEVDRDLLVADLLIKDERAIDLVRDEKKPLREISCGYDAEYVQVEPGIAYQRQIIGNHVALVERGRAGPRCSIQDEETMPQSKPKTGMSALFAKMIRAMRTGDQALLARVADEAAEEQERIEDEEREAAEAEAKKQTADTIAELKKTVDELESKVAELQAKVGDDDTEELDENGQPKAKTGDNDGEPTDEEKTKTEDAMRDTMPRAEILVPGFTVDAAPKRPADVVALQRKVLRAADAAALQPLLAGRTVDALPDDAVATVFIAAAEMKRATNNARAQVPGRTQDHRGQPGAVTAAEINRRNAEFYKQSN